MGTTKTQRFTGKLLQFAGAWAVAGATAVVVAGLATLATGPQVGGAVFALVAVRTFLKEIESVGL